MKKYRLENGKLIKYNGGFIISSDKHIFVNPTEERLLAEGYKDVVYDTTPEYDEATQYLEKDIEEQDTYFIIHWIIRDLIIEEESQPSGLWS